MTAEVTIAGHFQFDFFGKLYPSKWAGLKKTAVINFLIEVAKVFQKKPQNCHFLFLLLVKSGLNNFYNNTQAFMENFLHFYQNLASEKMSK